MYGHSGAAVEVPLVLESAPPRDREARLDVINRIYEHVTPPPGGSPSSNQQEQVLSTPHRAVLSRLIARPPQVAYVKSGDNTLASALAAVQQVTEQPGDDYFVFLLSDAMLEQYNISPQVNSATRSPRARTADP